MKLLKTSTGQNPGPTFHWLKFSFTNFQSFYGCFYAPGEIFNSAEFCWWRQKAIVMYLMNFFVLAKSPVICFVYVSSFSVISDNFALWRYSTSFDAIPQDAQNQIRNCSSHIGSIFWRSLVVTEPFFTYLWLPTYILFLPHFLLASRGSSHSLLYLITDLHKTFWYCRGSERGDTECIYRAFYFVFFSIDVCIRQCMYLWAKHLCIHNLLTYQ